MSEAEFLKQQADHAKAAFGSSLRNTGSDAVKMADPRVWAKSHPWATVAVAAAAGFVAANIRIPSLKPAQAPEGTPKQPETGHRAETAFQWLKHIIAIIKPLLETWLAAQATAAHAQSDGKQTPDSPATTADQSPY